MTSPKYTQLGNILDAELNKLDKNIGDVSNSIDISNALFELSLLARSIIAKPITIEMGTRQAHTAPDNRKTPAQLGYNIEAYTQRLISAGRNVEADFIRDIYAVLRHYSNKINEEEKK